jgi:DNA repair protein RadC
MPSGGNLLSFSKEVVPMSMSSAVSEAPLVSAVPTVAEREAWIIHEAIALLERRVFQRGPSLLDPRDVRQFLKLKLAGEGNEVFAVIFLDSKHRVLAFEALFTGTIDAASVYPRVVLKRAIEWNASSLILTHNHPSGCTQPSSADRALTTRLRDVLALVDIRVLDHFVVGQGEPFSFAESGLL